MGKCGKASGAGQLQGPTWRCGPRQWAPHALPSPMPPERPAQALCSAGTRRQHGLAAVCAAVSGRGGTRHTGSTSCRPAACLRRAQPPAPVCCLLCFSSNSMLSGGNVCAVFCRVRAALVCATPSRTRCAVAAAAAPSTSRRAPAAPAATPPPRSGSVSCSVGGSASIGSSGMGWEVRLGSWGVGKSSGVPQGVETSSQAAAGIQAAISDTARCCSRSRCSSMTGCWTMSQHWEGAIGVAGDTPAGCNGSSLVLAA